MAGTFQHFELALVSPNFDSKLMDALMELNHLRKLELHGTTAPWLFFQLKEIFHLLESVGSARIEGNQTTISEYVEQKISKTERSSDRFSEIANVEQAMMHIDQSIDVGSDISHHFIRELHQIAVSGLEREGDKTPGAYRTWDVEIASSDHLPPEAHRVQEYMDELVNFINNGDDQKYDLIKVAIAHHRFVWVHPFGNGNGRVVRLLTYALLIKYGFRVKDGQIINPTAVFCNDREKYYESFGVADEGSAESMLQWCEYVLIGICDEISKVNKLLNHDYLLNQILLPAISLGVERKLITRDEETVLKMAVELQKFKASDVRAALPSLSSRQVTHMISKLKENGLINSIKENGREYYVAVNNNYLMRGLITLLEEKEFIPAIS